MPSFTPTPGDPRLAAVSANDGSIDPAIVEALLSTPPSLLTIPEIEAMSVVLDEVQFWPNNPVALTFTQDWLEAFHRVIGGTITREKVRHGEVVERTVEHHRGRADVQTYRAQNLPPTASPTLARPQARRRGAGRPAGARRSSRSAESGDPDGESSDDDGDAWPGGFSFRAYDELISTALPGHVRARLLTRSRSVGNVRRGTAFRRRSIGGQGDERPDL